MVLKDKILAQSVIIFTALLMLSGFANASYSGAFTDSVSTANVGATFTTTFQVTNTSGTGSGSGTATLTIDSDYFSTSDSLAKTCSFGGASTCSVSWTLQAIKQGSQDWSALATIGSDSASGSHSSITVNQAPTYSLSFTEDESDNILSGGELVSFSLSVTNNGGSASTSALLEYDSSDFTLTLGSASVSLGTISQGGSASTSWKLTAASPVSSSSPQVTVTVSGGGSTSSETLTFTKYTSQGSDSGGDGGGGGGGAIGGGASDNKKNVTQKPVPPGLVNNTKLQAAIEKVLAKGKLNQNAIDNLMRLSAAISGESTISRTINSGSSKSNVTTKIKYTGSKAAKNYVVYEKVPKTFANSSDLITVTAIGAKIEVVQKDPEYAIIFDTVNPNQELEIIYSVSKSVSTSTVNSFSSEVYAESLTEAQSSPQVCAQVITPAKNPATGECKEFATPCEVPIGWNTVDSCKAAGVSANDTITDDVKSQDASRFTIILIVLVSFIVLVIGYFYLKKRNE